MIDIAKKKQELENKFNDNKKIMSEILQQINDLKTQLELINDEQKKIQGGYDILIQFEKEDIGESK